MLNEKHNLVSEIGQGGHFLESALAFRSKIFRASSEKTDEDAWDKTAYHILISNDHNEVFATARLMLYHDASLLKNAYSGQFFELSSFNNHHAPFLEIGRLATHQNSNTPYLIQLIFAEITRFVIKHHVKTLIGCVSFFKYSQSDSDRHRIYAYCADHHLGSRRLHVATKGDGFKTLSNFTQNDKTPPLHIIPPLLRTYLRMGGWVSDALAYDADLQSELMFITLEIDKIPQARAKRLIKNAS